PGGLGLFDVERRAVARPQGLHDVALERLALHRDVARVARLDGDVGLDLGAHGELDLRHVRVVGEDRDPLGDRTGEVGGVDYGAPLARLARRHRLVEVRDRAAAGRLDVGDLQHRVAVVADHELAGDLVALGDRPHVLDGLGGDRFRFTGG